MFMKFQENIGLNNTQGPVNILVQEHEYMFYICIQRQFLATSFIKAISDFLDHFAQPMIFFSALKYRKLLGIKKYYRKYSMNPDFALHYLNPFPPKSDFK